MSGCSKLIGTEPLTKRHLRPLFDSKVEEDAMYATVILKLTYENDSLFHSLCYRTYLTLTCVNLAAAPKTNRSSKFLTTKHFTAPINPATLVNQIYFPNTPSHLPCLTLTASGLASIPPTKLTNSIDVSPFPFCSYSWLPP